MVPRAQISFPRCKFHGKATEALRTTWFVTDLILSITFLFLLGYVKPEHINHSESWYSKVVDLTLELQGTNVSGLTPVSKALKIQNS